MITGHAVASSAPHFWSALPASLRSLVFAVHHSTRSRQIHLLQPCYRRIPHAGGTCRGLGLWGSDLPPAPVAHFLDGAPRCTKPSSLHAPRRGSYDSSRCPAQPIPEIRDSFDIWNIFFLQRVSYSDGLIRSAFCFKLYCVKNCWAIIRGRLNTTSRA